MKIEQASLELTTAHELSCERQVDYECSVSFRQVYTDVQTADAEARAAEERERLLLLVERLTRGLIDLIFGGAGAKPVELREILSADCAASGEPTAEAPASGGRGMLRFDWTTRTTETVSEHERTQFGAQGEVRTADGRTLQFDLDLAMCRDFTCTREQVRTGTTELRDPLVINFDGKACELSGKRFAFDLDLDAQAEQIPVLGDGSGYLALDRNGDAQINDGGELFGASSGNGFADLAKFDQDGNGWIDEADPVFERLRIWRTNGEGEARLTGLREEGVGAIYLESAGSPFKLADAANQTLGQIRATGIYLRENGGVGTVQQVDLSV